MLDIRCGLCGSNDIDITDKRYCDEGFKVVCNSCFNSEYAKTIEELPIVIEKSTHPNKVRYSGHPKGRHDRRKMDYIKAIRKKKLADEFYLDSTGHPYYHYLHQYSKNKIHCSCRMCTAKTKDSVYGLNYKISDLRKLGLDSTKRARSHSRV